MNTPTKINITPIRIYKTYSSFRDCMVQFYHIRYFMSIANFVAVLKGGSENHLIFIKYTETVYFIKNRVIFPKKYVILFTNPETGKRSAYRGGKKAGGMFYGKDTDG